MGSLDGYLDFKNRPGEWGRLDSNQRIPKKRDLQSAGIPPLATHSNAYQPKIQQHMFC